LALGRPSHAFAAQCDAILAAGESHQELIALLPTIAVPTLVMVGNQDILTPRGDSEDLAATIPTAEFVVISGAAHGFMVEHATTFNRVLLEFLGRAERAYQGRLAEQDELDTRARRLRVLQPADARRHRRSRDLWTRRRAASHRLPRSMSCSSTRDARSGGRLATRRIGDATVDHGAQFFTVRTPAFQRQVDDWVDRGLATVWSHGFTTSDGHPRYVATSGMNSLAKDLATGPRRAVFDHGVRNPTRLRCDVAPWQLVIDDGTVHDADAVIVTTPLPQAFALLADSGIAFAESLFTDYDRTIALLATLDRPAAIPPPGGVQSPTPDIGFVADNHAKGVSATPAITLHASPSWSEAHWDDDIDTLRSALIELADTWLGGAAVIEAHVKKWRFATPRSRRGPTRAGSPGAARSCWPATPSTGHGWKPRTTRAWRPPTRSAAETPTRPSAGGGLAAAHGGDLTGLEIDDRHAVGTEASQEVAERRDVLTPRSHVRSPARTGFASRCRTRRDRRRAR
jgi:renalase